MASAETKGDTNVKETIESILVAFILAFIFRCFVVEAFVIPTGSMAPTLLGANMQFRCPDCGYRFTAGYSERNNESFSVPEQANKVYSIICPNCGYRLPRELANDSENDASNPTVRYGDRILVMKYLYLVNDPHRWDVIVFKTPDNPGAQGDYTVNYIKRLIGKPGERLFVAEGDLYVSRDTGKAAVASDFTVQTKPRHVQDALWRIVYDTDYVPTNLPRSYTSATGEPLDDAPWQQPWQPGGQGWVNGDSSKGISARQFAFDNLTGQGALQYDTRANPNKTSLTDFLAYDQTRDQDAGGRIRDTFAMPSYGRRDGQVANVSDLKLSFVVDRFTGPGTVSAVVGKGEVEFAAEVSADKVRLIKRLGAATRVIGETPLKGAWPLTVAIENVDYRVDVTLNGREVLHTTAADYAPDVAAVIDRSQSNQPGPAGYARVDAQHAQLQLSHLQLWRDVYYRDTDNGIARGTARDFPNHVVDLGKDEYFAMGDNSYMSLDGRYWNERVDLDDEDLHVEAGRLPGRFLLGKAFFVYWPAGYRPVTGFPPVVPNFGEMRFIR